MDGWMTHRVHDIPLLLLGGGGGVPLQALLFLYFSLVSSE